MLRNVVISTSIDNILDSQDLLPTGVGTTGWLLHEENSETLSPVSGVDEDIAEPGEGRCVGDPTAYPYLLPPLRGVAPEGDGARYRTSHELEGPALGPVTLFAQPPVDPIQVKMVLVVAHPVAVVPPPVHRAEPTGAVTRQLLPGPRNPPGEAGEHCKTASAEKNPEIATRTHTSACLDQRNIFG